MYNHAYPMSLGTVVGLVLLVLNVVSTPIVHSIYFLRAETSSDTEKYFGVWGYCSDSCSSSSIGYTYGSEITSVSAALILFPITTGLSALQLLMLLPLLRRPGMRPYPHSLLYLLSLATAAASLAAFIVTVYIFSTAMSRFSNAGDSASFGPSFWMSLVAAIALCLVGAEACWSSCTGGFGRYKPELEYYY